MLFLCLRIPIPCRLCFLHIYHFPQRGQGEQEGVQDLDIIHYPQGLLSLYTFFVYHHNLPRLHDGEGHELLGVHRDAIKLTPILLLGYFLDEEVGVIVLPIVEEHGDLLPVWSPVDVTAVTGSPKVGSCHVIMVTALPQPFSFPVKVSSTEVAFSGLLMCSLFSFLPLYFFVPIGLIVIMHLCSPLNDSLTEFLHGVLRGGAKVGLVLP